MTEPPPPTEAAACAERLVRELMLVSVLVAGEGGAELAEALRAAGAEADIFQPGQAPSGVDLAILLTRADVAADPATREAVDALARASDRLLLAPLPLGEAAAPGGPALPQVSAWFELFAEHGYQPVVEFEAGFVSAGAFLVDRGATADEADLAAFTDRMQLGQEAARAQREAVQEAERDVRAELLGVRAELARTQAELADMTQRARAWAEAAEAARAALAEALATNKGWDSLRAWTRLEVADPARNSLARLARDLPRLNELRAPDLPPLALPSVRRPGWLARLFGAREVAPPVLAEVAALRAAAGFDAAWVIASVPELSVGIAVDPGFYQALVVVARGG